MEAITDLATIYVDFGMFTSNTLLRRRGWVEGNVEGWSVSRKGYISPEVADWALNLFAWARGEKHPKWAKHLSVDPREYLELGLRYLAETHDTAFALGAGAVGPVRLTTARSSASHAGIGHPFGSAGKTLPEAPSPLGVRTAAIQLSRDIPQHFQECILLG